MNNFARAHNSYLEPPDDDPVCETGCGETLVRDFTGIWLCENKFCPLKFQGVEQEMAYKLVDALDNVRTYRRLYERTAKELDGYLLRERKDQERHKKNLQEWEWTPNMDAE